jgi:hypothetical protein
VLRYAYLGPAGTFTEAALRQLAAPDVATYLPQVEVVAAIEAERRGAADFAVVAIENSVEGAAGCLREEQSMGDEIAPMWASGSSIRKSAATALLARQRALPLGQAVPIARRTR